MALWCFDTVPVSLTALVVICVAGGEYNIRIAYLSYSTTETHTSWIWPCRIEEGGGSGTWAGVEVGLWIGIAVPIGSVLYS